MTVSLMAQVREPASHAASAILAIGQPDFGQAVLDAVRETTRAHYITVVLFSGTHAPTVTAMGSDRPAAAMVSKLAHDYVARHYREDPNYGVIDRSHGGRDMVLMHPRMADFSNSYREHFFGSEGISDKITIAYTAHDIVVTTNVYACDTFSAAEVDSLASVGMIVGTAAVRHSQLASSAPKDLATLARTIGWNHGASLTAREIHTCEGILRGQSSEAIALDLGIGVASVVTYRKSLYRKLGIVSQAQLLALALQAGTPSTAWCDRMLA